MELSDSLETEGVSLVNRGIALWSQGRREDTAVAMRRGIEVCRRLAVMNPAKSPLLNRTRNVAWSRWSDSRVEARPPV